jgi:PHD/YefM family antitoxin component YafN of YafNO toxin-antitoxin module
MGVLSIAEARAQLPDLLARFREAGPAAEPVVLGRRRHAEAVLVHYERYRSMVDDLEAAQAWIATFWAVAELSRIPR